MPNDHSLPKVHFRPFEPQDYPRLLAAIESPQALAQWAGPFFRSPLDEAQLEAYRASAMGEASTRRIYTACDDTGQPVGHIELNDIDGYSARLCRVLIDPPSRGRGFGRAMVRQALHIGFDELGLQRIDLGVYDFNTAAIHCYELEGFVKEGHLRQARRVGDEIWSTDLMGILEGEWRQLESARADANPGDGR
jgi:RimJ/RimL family protein N-acetyltransferase